MVFFQKKKNINPSHCADEEKVANSSLANLESIQSR